MAHNECPHSRYGPCGCWQDREGESLGNGDDKIERLFEPIGSRQRQSNDSLLLRQVLANAR